jgi:hypothetical protein
MLLIIYRVTELHNGFKTKQLLWGLIHTATIGTMVNFLTKQTNVTYLRNYKTIGEIVTKATAKKNRQGKYTLRICNTNCSSTVTVVQCYVLPILTVLFCNVTYYMGSVEREFIVTTLYNKFVVFQTPLTLSHICSFNIRKILWP